MSLCSSLFMEQFAGGPMEYDEDNEASGSIPEFGAIFMSNIHTKKECFRRKMFALPSSKAEFVKHIKAGMVLFLFESEKRQLFGVFQASSDGAMNIVPNAFTYPERHFPAQVCFTPIWYCHPVSEKEFRDAIRGNYFSAKKFNFGLSKDQVHRLLYLFSSRKLKNKMPPRPLAGAITGVAGKKRRLVGDDRLNSSERGYMEPAEYDEFNPAAFGDYHVNSFARLKEEEVFIDDGVNTEGKVYPFAEGDFLAKRRRIGNDDRLITQDVAENGIYNHCTQRNFHIGSPKDSVDAVRRLPDTRGLSSVERLRNENQVGEILNPDLLDVRAADGYRFMQTSRLFDEYNSHNGSGKVFASDIYGKSLDEGKSGISDDRFLLDDCTQRDYNVDDTVIPMVYGDGNPNLYRQAREMVDDHDCFMDRKMEARYHFDNDGSPAIAFEHSATLLHNIRKTTAAGAFPINENEPDLGTSSLREFSSENFSRPLHCGHRIIHSRKYPIVEGRVTENMVDSILCSATSARNAGYNASVDRKVVPDGRFRKIERVNEEDTQTITDPVISANHPSFCQLKGNLSSISGKLLPENRLSQFPVSDNFDVSCSKFDDATITKAVPYLPEYPNFSHGYSVSMGANQNCRLVQENNPHPGNPGSLGNFYSLSSDRSLPYFSDLKKSNGPLDMTSEYGNKGFSTSKFRDQSSLLHDSPSSFINSNLSMHMDLDTSTPVNYRDSFFSKLSPKYTDLENIGEKGLSFAHPYKSRDHFAYDGNISTASERVSKHVANQDVHKLAGKDFICSEANNLGVGICHPEIDLKGHENQYFRFFGNMEPKELHKISEAPHANSNLNRRSVFTRLTSREKSHVNEERNDFNFDCRENFMDATADEVMGMLQQGDNLSLRKLGKSRVFGQPKHGENSVNEKKELSHIETNHSKMEKKRLDNASLATADSMDEVPKETRVMDFKRRSDRKKILVGISADSATRDEITGANEDIKSSMKTTLKRKKLVRPVFSKTESASDPAPILDKDDKGSSGTTISICKAGMPDNNTRLGNVLASHTNQPIDCNNKEPRNPEEQMNVVAYVVPSTSHELKGHKPTMVDLQIGSSNVVLKETTQQKKSLGIQTSVEGILAEDVEKTTVGSSLQQSSLEGLKLGAGSGNNLIAGKRFKDVEK